MGAYTAERAAALSGVPKSTIDYWARGGVLAPSVSPTRVKLWSYSDLMALRTIYWLRQKKTEAAGPEIPPTGMRAIRRALERLRELGEPVWGSDRKTLWVDEKECILLQGPEGLEAIGGQRVLPGCLDLTAPFSSSEGLRGPDLVAPRADLRIVADKLSGSPHIVGTRLETRALAALSRDGLALGTIASLYPFVSPAQIQQALDLEEQLEANVALSAAA